ncbi:hypothetical protein [Hutsoniella sourekii]|uniref:hypothetical protein n=1 Tax=Hutsoniella sourekii TaxID=87650 RepID=UPI0004827E61|nr:hypothetical protein [Hutsoniella sourekii]
MKKVKKSIYLSKDYSEKLDEISRWESASLGDTVERLIRDYEKPDNKKLLLILRNIEKKIETLEIVLNTLLNINEKNIWFDLGDYDNVKINTADTKDNPSDLFIAAEDYREAKILKSKIDSGEIPL